jgi:hypothetical protein
VCERSILQSVLFRNVFFLDATFCQTKGISFHIATLSVNKWSAGNQMGWTVKKPFGTMMILSKN